MADFALTPEVLEHIADRFRVLAEPARLGILNAVRARELTVTEIMEVTGLAQANTSKHLQLLYERGFLDRRKEGVYVYYRLADDDVFRLCDIMCGRLAQEMDSRNRLLQGALGRGASKRR